MGRGGMGGGGMVGAVNFQLCNLIPTVSKSQVSSLYVDCRPGRRPGCATAS